VIVGPLNVLINFKTSDEVGDVIELARSQSYKSPRATIETDNCQPTREPDLSLVHAVARAHSWLWALSDGTYKSIEELAAAAKWNPKVIRKALRLAFLAPAITEAIMCGAQPKSLKGSDLQGMSAYAWDEQRRLLGLLPAT
jgi:hypothetical protein